MRASGQRILPVSGLGRVHDSTRKSRKVELERDLGARDGLETFSAGCLGELHGAVEAVVIGQGEGRITQLLCPKDQLFGMGCAVQEGKPRVGVELDVGRSGHRLTIFGFSSAMEPNITRKNETHKQPKAKPRSGSPLQNDARDMRLGNGPADTGNRSK